MGFYQLRLIGNGTDLESQLHVKTRITRYRARDPWSARSTPHMLRERERERARERERERDRGEERDMQTAMQIERLRKTYRLIDGQTEKFNRHTQRHNPKAYADPGKTGAQSPRPLTNPCKVP